MTYINKFAIVDEGAKIGINTKVWHFTHVPSAEIEIIAQYQNCFIGENKKLEIM